MVEKNRKLQNQFEAEASTSSHGGSGSMKPIFDGVSIFVDGFTVPSSQVMLDTGGPELQVVNKTEHPISLQAETLVISTPDQEKEATSNLLPINFSGLSKGLYLVS